MNPRRALDQEILRLALPAAGSALLQVAHRAIDQAWVGRLGTEALAAMTISQLSVWVFAALGWLVGMGLTAVVARYLGAGRAAAGAYVAGQGVRWALALGAVGAVGGWFLAPLLFASADAEPGVRAEGLTYTRVYWAGGAAVLLRLASDATFRAHGNTATPFRIALVALALNVTVTPLLIFGVGPLPALGVAGAAVATVAAEAVGALLGLSRLRRRGFLSADRPPDEELRFNESTRLGHPGRLGLDLAVFARMARVGLPTLAASLLFNFVLLELMRAAQSAGGAAAQAALGVGHTGEGVAFVLGLGWSSAAAALVGRRLGAADPKGAERAAWRAGHQCAILCGVWGLLLFALAEPLAGFFAREPQAIGHAAAYLRIVSLCLVPQAYELVLDGAFGGAGMTIPPTVVGVSMSLLRIPLAWWAVDAGHGVAGVWAVISATAFLRGLLLMAWFARGTWKTRSV